MKCNHCGAEIPDDSLFCESCGKKIDGSNVILEHSKKKLALWIGIAAAAVVAVVLAIVLFGGGGNRTMTAEEIFNSLNEEEHIKTLPDGVVLTVCENGDPEASTNIISKDLNNVNEVYIEERNLLNIMVSQTNDVYVRCGEKYGSIEPNELRDIVKVFLGNPTNRQDLPQKEEKEIRFNEADSASLFPISQGIVFLHSASDASITNDVVDIILQSVYELRDELSYEKYGVSFRDLTEMYKSRAIREAIPISIIKKTEESNLKSQEWVDLGLPSGTLWSAKTEVGLFTQDEAINIFGRNLPTISDLRELTTKCTWRIEGRQFKVIGPNGNFILLSANGDGDNVPGYRIGCFGSYWSSSKTNESGFFDNGLIFYIDHEHYLLCRTEPSTPQSVRLVTKKTTDEM